MVILSTWKIPTRFKMAVHATLLKLWWLYQFVRDSTVSAWQIYYPLINFNCLKNYCALFIQHFKHWICLTEQWTRARCHVSALLPTVPRLFGVPREKRHPLLPPQWLGRQLDWGSAELAESPIQASPHQCYPLESTIQWHDIMISQLLMHNTSSSNTSWTQKLSQVES